MPQFKRNERINEMSDVVGFLQAWNQPDHPENTTLVDFHVTQYGNINSTGELGNYRGHALTRWHPQFSISIEQGVREMVCLLTQKIGWVTYTSCEGHRYDHNGPHPVERHVGVLPRSKEEAPKIESIFRQVVVGTNSQHWLSAVRVEQISHNILSDGQIYPAIDLFFRRRSLASWQSYFSNIESCYRTALDILRLVVRSIDTRDNASSNF